MLCVTFMAALETVRNHMSRLAKGQESVWDGKGTLYSAVLEIHQIKYMELAARTFCNSGSSRELYTINRIITDAGVM